MKGAHPLFSKGCKGTIGRVVTVDPGLGGTGVAEWKDFQIGDPVKPSDTGVIRSNRKDWIDKSDEIAKAFGTGWAQEGTTYILEIPELWTGSATSITAASTGNLFKLAILIGRLMEVAAYHCNAYGGYTFVLITARAWKGQLSKHAVHTRIRRALGKKYREHEADAVGMGLAMQSAEGHI